jgi:hypothetical protein
MYRDFAEKVDHATAEAEVRDVTLISQAATKTRNPDSAHGEVSLCRARNK